MGKIDGGMIISIGPNQVPRVIGREGSMVKMIKDATGCDVTVGQNGKVWISGKNTDNEVVAWKIVEFIGENAVTVGLTEKVEKMIKGMELKVSPVEIVAENTDEGDDE